MADAKSNRIANLDGLRGVAICGVVFGHFVESPGLPDEALWLVRVSNFFGLAQLGVQLFFLISGFIITYLLINEEKKFGSVSLGNFWLRRAFRILPPLLIFLCGTFLVSTIAPVINPKSTEYWMALTFSRGWWDSQGGWWLGHTWSLAIEEQFYILWPILFIAGGKQRLWWLLFFTAVLMFAVPHFLSEDLLKIQAYLLPANAIYLTAGCVLALVWRGLPVRAAFLWLTPALLLLGILAQRNDFQQIATLLNAGGLFAALAVWVSNHQAPGVSVLCNPVLQWLGRISFSLYLWQQLFLGPYGTEFWQTAPINLLMALLIAHVAYRWVEAPSLTWRKRVTGQ